MVNRPSGGGKSGNLGLKVRVSPNGMSLLHLMNSEQSGSYRPRYRCQGRTPVHAFGTNHHQRRNVFSNAHFYLYNTRLLSLRRRTILSKFHPPRATRQMDPSSLPRCPLREHNLSPIRVSSQPLPRKMQVYRIRQLRRVVHPATSLRGQSGGRTCAP